MAVGACDARKDWANFEPSTIPSKSDLSPLKDWLLSFEEPGSSPILDLGCGTGAVAQKIATLGFPVTGVDINPGAVSIASISLPLGSFFVRDVAASAGLEMPLDAFAGVVCQLLLSIIGKREDRVQVLLNAFDSMLSKARIFISFSGRSEDINSDYELLYRSDAGVTGEEGTYISRDADGRALYWTHHFQAEEIRGLLSHAGFLDISIEERIESSSRRPDQRARFYYATARKSK